MVARNKIRAAIYFENLLCRDIMYLVAMFNCDFICKINSKGYDSGYKSKYYLNKNAIHAKDLCNRI